MPLVSIGIPAYNRPDGLKRTLECLTAQTYKNLEIIISDNASPDANLIDIVNNCFQNERRIKFYRQSQNIGAINNFNYVLKRAAGQYFMWAADDDEWDLTFIETCVAEHQKLGQEYVAVMTETQYFWGSKKFDFFPEGRAFYDTDIQNVEDRLFHMITNNYGDLYYSMFARDALFEGDVTFFDFIAATSLNEIPLFLYVCTKGKWRVLPEVKFYKHSSPKSVAQARWENVGGALPEKIATNEYKTNLSYHNDACLHIESTIYKLNISDGLKANLIKEVYIKIMTHFGFLLNGFKPAVHAEQSGSLGTEVQNHKATSVAIEHKPTHSLDMLSSFERPPKITIGLPVYNGGEYVKFALTSALAQTYRDFELIISDNASEDDTLEVVKSISAQDPRVTICSQKINLGAAGNFSFVLDRARGKYFIWLAADDYWNTEYLASLVELHEKGHDVALAFPKVVSVDASGSYLREYPAIFSMSENPTTLERLQAVLWAEESEGKANLVYGLFERDKLQSHIKKSGLMLSYGYGQWGVDNLFVFSFAQQGQYFGSSDAVLYKRAANQKYSLDDPIDHFHEMQGYFQGYRSIVQISQLPQLQRDLTISSISIRETFWYAKMLNAFDESTLRSYINKMIGSVGV
jgi:glycosyltransferase involved in cell wall biosynthesis